MRLNQPYRKLGRVDGFDALRAAVLELSDDVWLQDTSRQEIFSNVHGSTQTLVLLFCDGWPAVNVETRSAWDLLGEPALVVMKNVVSGSYKAGGRVIRAMVAKLPAGTVINRHYDAHPSFSAAHRVHVPLITHQDVNFLIEEKRVPLEEGFAYEIDNLRLHEVKNLSPIDRLHFIFDYAPADRLELQPSAGA
ncbi:MAG: aspartyl/asparaginyl beta-hydroxylase domain-containing protein [Pseudomonadota bacterium]